MAHLMSLSAVLEMAAAIATIGTETNPLVLIGTLSMGSASAVGAVWRYLAASSNDKEWEESLARGARN